MSDSSDDAERTRSIVPTDATGGGLARSYLLIVDGRSSTMFALPHDGVVIIGRGADADLKVDDASVSRRHAKILVADGVARVSDLGSHNGTRVNAERIEGARALGSGDVVTVGDVPMVVRAAQRAVPGRALLDLNQLRQRLDEEIERALTFERPLSVVAVALGAAPRDHARAGQVVESRLRRIDVGGWLGYTQLLLMLPELDGQEAIDLATRLVEALAPLAPAVRAGLAACPEDGCEADALLEAARAAAAIAHAGEVGVAAQALVTHRLGERSVLVADAAMIQTFELLRRLAQSDLPVLISGETGAGKENAAFAVHQWSPRAARPFVTLNCAALQETLVESELFGYEKGAFSGAVKTKPGLLESASGGTVFLDEIGELPPGAQAKLLRALEQKRITRLGDVRDRPIDIRIVAATHRRLDEDVKSGRFRQDLYFRLNTATVVLPPLRERPREIAILARTFLEAACVRAGRRAMDLAPSAMRLLARHPWPGNVRELKNVMDYAAAAVTDERLETWHLPEAIRGPAARAAAVATTLPDSPASTSEPAADDDAMPRVFRPLAEEQRELERRRMTEALQVARGNQTRAAELIAMPLRTFVKRMKEYGLGARSSEDRD